MPLHLRVARCGIDRDAVYRLRAAEQPVPLQPPVPGAPVPRAADPADAWPSTTLLLAEEAGQVIGTLRARRFTGIPAEDAGLAADDVRIDAVVVAGPHRERPGLLFTLLKGALSAGGGLVRIDAPGWCAPTLRAVGFASRAGRWEVPYEALRPSFLEALPPEVASFGADPHRLVLRREEPLFRRGDPAGAVYLVVRGSVRLEGLRPDGQREVLSWAGPGELVGEEACLEGSRYCLDALAGAAETDVLAQPAAAFRERIDQDPLQRRFFHQVLTGRLMRVTAQPLGRAPERVVAKVAEILAERPEERVPLRWLQEHSGATELELQEALSRLGAWVLEGCVMPRRAQRAA